MSFRYRAENADQWMIDFDISRKFYVFPVEMN